MSEQASPGGEDDAAVRGRSAVKVPAVPGLVWSWSGALRGCMYGLPAAVVCPFNPERGIPLALGVIPACLLPLPADRRSRAVVVVLGSLCGLSMMLGALIAQLPSLVGALALVVVVLASALAVSVRPAGRVVLFLGAPITAVGLSFSDLGSALAGAVLMAAGSLYAWVVSLLWPSRRRAVARPADRPERSAMYRYGILLGSCAGLAWVATSSLGLDHPGWAPSACLLVARPDPQLLRLRAMGRVVAVTVGALAAVAAVAAELPAVVVALLALTTITGAAATRASRWYVTSAFTTFLVVLMLLIQHPEQSGQKLSERVLETLLGVVLALVAGALASVPTARAHPSPAP